MLTKNIADMSLLVLIAFLQVNRYVRAEIRDSVIGNKLIKVKPVGGNVVRNFVPLTKISPPNVPHTHGKTGRRHFTDYNQKLEPREIFGEGSVHINAGNYIEGAQKTVVTMVIPDHIDRAHYEVSTQVPYYTVGPIQALGYHPSTMKNEYPNECEKIYQDHIAEQYSDESTDYTDESLEMARMPVSPFDQILPYVEGSFEKRFSEFKK